ncbi:MAG: helix-turn-helix domain-containing protein [Solirubrobacteraceae bacterium]
MLDAREVAELLRMRLSTVLEFARRGVIPGHKLGRRWIFLRDEIEATVRRAPAGKAESPIRLKPSASAARQRRAGRQPAAPAQATAAQPQLFA